MYKRQVLRYIGHRNNRIRQAKEQEKEKVHQEELLKAAKKAEAANAVSYTHLDVYKRQPVLCISEKKSDYQMELTPRLSLKEKINGARQLLSLIHI